MDQISKDEGSPDLIKKKLTPEQKKGRMLLLFVDMIKKVAKEYNMPIPFPLTQAEKKEFEKNKLMLIQKEKELKQWRDYVRNNNWIHEYIDPFELEKTITYTWDVKRMTDKEWNDYMYINVLRKLREEKEKKKGSEKPNKENL